MAVVVFDSDVLIGYLNRDDAHHEDAITRLRKTVGDGVRRLLCAVNYSEVLVGPVAAEGPRGGEIVDALLVSFNIEAITVDMDLARRAAAVRARTKLKLPDAYAIATAVQAEKRGWGDVRLESFDRRLTNAYATLRSR